MRRKYILICAIILIINLILFYFTKEDELGVKMINRFQLVSFLLGYYYLSKMNNNFFSNYGIFLLFFYLFQNGHLLLYSLNIDYDYYYVEKYEIQTVYNASIYSTLCLVAAFAAGVFSVKSDSENIFFKKMNEVLSKGNIKNIRNLWRVASIIALPFAITKFILTIKYGYLYTLSYLAEISSFFKVVDKIFIAMTILLIVCSKKKVFFIKFIFFIWAILIAFSGDRTIGMGAFVINIILYFNKNKKNKFKKIIVMLIGIVILMYLVEIIFNFRMHYETKEISLLKIIVQMIGTLGFSFFPNILIMRICPNIVDYMYGKSYVGAIISGIIPQNLDIFGITDIFRKWSSYPTTLIENYYNYSFGIDFSLIAESYINFGKYGFFMIFFTMIIVARLLKQVNYNRRDNLYSQYITIVLLFSWFTLPRRKSYYIFNNFIWYVFFIGIIVLILNKIVGVKKKKCKINH